MKVSLMKRTAPTLFLGLLFFVLTLTPVYAQNSLQNAGLKTTLQEVKEKRQELRKEIRDRRVEIGKVASAAAGIKAKSVEAVKVAFEKILSRFDAALVRLDRISNRIATRIDKLNAKGLDTSAAKAALLSAEKSGAAAREAIDKAKSDVAAIDTTSTVKDAVRAALSSVKVAKESLKSYQKALVLALGNLKAASSLREGSESGK